MASDGVVPASASVEKGTMAYTFASCGKLPVDVSEVKPAVESTEESVVSAPAPATSLPPVQVDHTLKGPSRSTWLDAISNAPLLTSEEQLCTYMATTQAARPEVFIDVRAYLMKRNGAGGAPPGATDCPSILAASHRPLTPQPLCLCMSQADVASMINM
jgi:hypothetical protein